MFCLLVLALFCPRAQAGQSDLYSLDWELARTGDGVMAVLWMTPGPGMYAYANTPGPSGQPTVLEIKAEPAGLNPGVFYPPGWGKKDSLDPAVTVMTYDRATPIFIVFDGKAASVPDISLSGRLTMLLCSDKSCWPVRAEVAKQWEGIDPAGLPLAGEREWFALFRESGGEAVAASVREEKPASGEGEELKLIEPLGVSPRYFQPGLEVTSLGKAVLLALLAGLILNFMPCVLPVVSLKLSGMVAAASIEEISARKSIFREHNIFFALGVLAYFIFLGGFLGLAGLAWGQLFQSPAVIMLLAGLVFVLGLSLFGLFNLPVIELKSLGGAGKSLKWSAFLTGVLATLLATPCSGPFLGGVLGWVLSRPPATIVLVFVFIGLGMASPYLVMAMRPSLVRFFPKPGPWVGYMERGVAFFRMATTVYLLEILPDSYDLRALILLLSAAFCGWIWGGWSDLTHSRARRWTTRSLAAVLLAATLVFSLSAPSPKAEWDLYSASDFVHSLGKENLLVEFTADWCPNCKVLEATTLTSKNLSRWKEDYALRLVKVDLTRDGAPGMALLKILGSRSIPVTAVFPKGEGAKNPLVLRDLFTPSQLDRALESVLDGP